MMIYEERGSRSRAARIASDLAAAMEALKQMAAAWRKSKPGRTAHIDGLHLAMRYSNGKPASILVIDAVPVPAMEPDGQPRRMKEQKA